MAIFKKGDRVRVLNTGGIGDLSVGQVWTVKNVMNGCIGGLEGLRDNNWYFNNDWFVLFSEPQYKPITPKVGERYRVLKSGQHFKQGKIIIIDRQDPSGEWWGKGTACINGGFNYLTTEYLELMEEPEGRWLVKGMLEQAKSSQLWLNAIQEQQERNHSGTSFRGYMMGMDFAQEPIKQSITTKAMNFIKSALLSKEDKTLIKAGYLNDDLSLTSTGKSALEFITFTANKKQLVTMAEEALAEDKE
jgi:hypothetical protein